MARSKDFISGWAMGWTAATEALLRSLDYLAAERDASRGAAEPIRMEAAGDKPSRRLRGHPPKSAPAPAEQPRRKRGRPPKTP